MNIDKFVIGLLGGSIAIMFIIMMEFLLKKGYNKIAFFIGIFWISLMIYGVLRIVGVV